MPMFPNATMYRWTYRDVADAHANLPRLTPYNLPLDAFSSPTTTAEGTHVPLAIASYTAIQGVNRFDFGDSISWEPVPAVAAGAKTLAELCRKLHETGSPRYADLFYKVDGMDLQQNAHFARLLFEHWDNTDYRYAVIMGGTFSWAIFNGKMDALSLLPARGACVRTAEKGAKETMVEGIKVIPLVKEGRAYGATAPRGTPQTVTLPDPRLAKLDPDFTEIRRTVTTIKRLLEQSARYMRVRLETAQQFTALRVLLSASANVGHGSSDKASELAAKARELETAVWTLMRELPLKDVLALDGADKMPERLKTIVVVEDINKEIDFLTQKLCSKLVDDAGFANRCADWVRLGIKENLHRLPEFATRRDKFVEALADALDTLLETGIDTSTAAKLFDALAKAPDRPAIDVGSIQAATAIDAFLSFLGTGRPYVRFALQNAPNFVGNLAGPPSLFIAASQAHAWWKIRTMATDAKSDIDAFLEKTRTDLSKGLAMKPVTRAAFEQAMKNRSIDELEKIKKDILDEFSGTRQSTMGWKTGALLLQLVALGIALSDYVDRKPTSVHEYGLAEIFDLAGVGTQTVSTTIAALDVAATAGIAAASTSKVELIQWFLVKLKDVAPKLQTAGMRVGLVAAFIGSVQAFNQIQLASEHGSKFGGAVGAMSLVGNVGLGYTCLAWLIPSIPLNPLVSVAAIVLVTAAGGLSMVITNEESRSGVNRVASWLVDAIKNGAFYEGLKAQPGIDAKLGDIATQVKDVYVFLPLPPNNDFVRHALKQAGFSLAQIDLVVEKVGQPIVPGGLVST